jgi:sulfite reductase (NADPH) flavoprotein alpha-component
MLQMRNRLGFRMAANGAQVTKRILFQIHWFLGITAGLVLALMGVTGATMSFEDEISEALSPRLYAPGVPSRPDLSPDQLIARVQADNPGYYIARLDWEMARDRSHSVRLSSSEGRGRKQGQVDRTTGAWLGAPAGEGFFHLMDDLHRWLALPGGGNGIGRQITAFSAIALIFFALSGLYLRWPRQALDWRAWLVLDLRKTGRNLWRALHVVIGTWVLLFYLLSALTGLWCSYDWYRQGVIYSLTGKAPGEEGRRSEKREGIAPRPSIDPAWTAFRRATGHDYVWVRITQPAPSQLRRSARRRAPSAPDRQI